jgi:hypothetical protein
MATFELWNTESGNLLGSFVTEALALAAVREAIQRNGERYGQFLALGCENSRGRSKVVASGPQLVEWAFQRDRPTLPAEGRRLAPS